MTERQHDKSDEAKLLPCPCCGSEAQFASVTDEDAHNFDGRYVHCKECDLSTALVMPLKGDVERELQERWNRRSAVSATATPAGLMRYCRACGSKGDVAAGYRNCCPDGYAEMLHPETASQARLGFLARLERSTPPSTEPFAWSRAAYRGVGFSKSKEYDDDVPLYQAPAPETASSAEVKQLTEALRMAKATLLVYASNNRHGPSAAQETLAALTKHKLRSMPAEAERSGGGNG